MFVGNIWNGQVFLRISLRYLLRNAVCFAAKKQLLYPRRLALCVLEAGEC
jgi:hypothetical protein